MKTELIFPLLSGLVGQEVPEALLFSMQSGLMVTSAVHAAVELKLADYLETPKTLEALAQETRTHPASLALLLRALAGIGIFQEREGEPPCFLNTERSRLLRSEAMADLVHLWGASYQWDAWKQLTFTIHTGKPALMKSTGEPDLWTYLQKHPDESLRFQRGLTVVSNLIIPALLEIYDFSDVQQVVDVGGGHGTLVLRLLERYPRLHGILFDRRSVLAQRQQGARPDLAPEVAARLTQMAGDFLTGVPTGADCYVLKNILMDWSDEEALTILRQCRRVMHPHAGRILVVEPVPGRNTPFTRFFSLQMAMLMQAAHHRTIEEHERLFRAAGLHLTEIYALGLEQRLLVGTPLKGSEEGAGA